MKFESIPENLLDEIQKYASIDAFRELVKAVALEEAAIARFIQAEANKIEAFTGKGNLFPTSPTNQQITDFQNAIGRVLEALNEKQKLLIRMMELSRRLTTRDVDQNG